jgi:N-acetyl-gamma-glutamyl-phosphate reductase
MMSLDELHEVYLDKYAAESFVRVLPKGKFPNIAQVRGSNYCDIGLSIDERTGRVIVLAAIDNLVKGAAGQAIQNMNLMLSLPEDQGLLLPPVFP